MKDISREGETPAQVPERARQAGERCVLAPSEPSIWTERMLTALKEGVRGGKWFSLSDKVSSVRALEAAFRKVKANGGAPGIDHMTIASFEQNLAEELPRLSKALMDGSYRPSGIKRVWIPKPGSKEKRPLGIPTVRDRVVQGAIRMALEPIFEKEFLDASYGFRPGRSCHQALRQVWNGLKAGRAHVVDADLRKCFDTIPHELIMQGLKEKVADGRLLGVIALFLKQGVMQSGGEEVWETASEEGTPQGSVISPLLANIALHGFDLLAQARGFDLVRYADDFVVLCKDRAEAESALEAVREWTLKVGLQLHPEKTRIVDYLSGESFEFLGHEFRAGFTYPKQKSKQRLRDKIRAESPRTSGRSLEATIARLNPILKGWYRYFRHCHPWTFSTADGFVRRRLRAILCKRHRFPLHGCGFAHYRWPTAYFQKRGLFSMEQTHAERSALS